MTKTAKQGTKTGLSKKSELSDAQLEDISGGPHFTTLDSRRFDFQGVGQDLRQPIGSVRATKV